MDAASILLALAAMGVTAGGDNPKAAAPIRHTTNFAGQSGWGPGTETPPPAAAPTYDRYPVAPAGTASSAVSPPPGISDRTRMAVTETGNALRDGVEAGIQAANQRLYQSGEQAVESTRNAAQEYGQQFQGWIGTTGNTAQPPAGIGTSAAPPPATGSRSQLSNPFAPAPTATATTTSSQTRGGLAPPPSWNGASADDEAWVNGGSGASPMERVASVGTPATQTSSGWTTINSAAAPPPMMHSRLLNSPASSTSQSLNSAPPASVAQPMNPAPPLATTGSSGPGFPVTITAGQPVDRGQSPDARQPPAGSSANDGWDFGWSGNGVGNTAGQPVNVGRYDANAGAARNDAATIRDSAASPGRDQLANQPGTSGAANSQPPAGRSDPWLDWPQANTAGGAAQSNNAPPTGTNANNLPAQLAAGSAAANTSPPPATTAATTPTIGTPPAGTGAPAPTTEQPPWMPLLVVSLSLAGSIGANLFLGWSYVDARQKYRTLVQKTANKFRRATSAA